MRIGSMFTFRVFGWFGLHACACFYFLLRPAASFTRPFALSMFLLVMEPS
jgi:hypothetical protein